MDTDLLAYQSLNTGAALLGSWASAVRSYKDNRKLMAYQAELNQQAVDRANEYNLPINQIGRQMEGLEAYGLNKNLIYGNGSILGKTTSEAPSVGLGKPQAPDYGGVIAKYNLINALTEAQNNRKYGNLIDEKVNETKQGIAESQARVDNLNSATQNNRNQDTWFWNNYELMRTKLENQTALLEGQSKVAVETANRLINQVANDNRYYDAVIDNITQTIAQRWKQLDLSAKELGGKLKLWAQTGNAMQLNAKANFIRSLTGQEMFNLEKEKWDKLGQEMYDKLRLGNFGQWLKNKWTEVNGQFNLEYGGSKQNALEQRTYHEGLDYSEPDGFFDLLKDMLYW